jgi:phosphoglycerate dehydrogenase-like enzyme
MHNLLILSQQADEYRVLIEEARLPGLLIFTKPASEINIVFGETGLIKSTLASLPALTWVQTTSAGVEALMDSSLRRDYTLTNARDVFGRLMREYVFGYLLAHERQIFSRFADQQAKRWNHARPGVLHGRTLGLLGVGSIGVELARMAKFLHMNVHGYTRSSKASPDIDVYFHGKDILKFASGVDYLISVLPNTPGTRKIVNMDVLKALPRHALFMNVGRGATLDEDALVRALNEKVIAGAVLDVFEQEPVPPEHPFWTTPDLLMTFHTSAPSWPEDLAKVFIENYKLFVEGRPLKHLVDFDRGY